MKHIQVLFIVVLFTTSATAGLDEDLIVYFTFDNVKGKKILDASGNDLDADVVANVEFIKGKYGNAIHIAAEPEGNECVHVPADDLLKIEGEITVMAWVYHEDWEAAWGSWLDRGSQMVNQVKKSYGMGFFDGHFIFEGQKAFKGPQFGMILGGGQKSWSFITSGSMVNKSWHHIAGTYSGRTRRIYLDGEIRSEGEQNFEFVGTNDVDLRIGCAVGHPGYIFKNGSIDEVGVWRRALTEVEIKEAMKDIFAVSPKDKVATTWGDIKRGAVAYE